MEEASIYERARRQASFAMWTIEMQIRRLNKTEPEDEKFVLRKVADFQFFLLALTKFRRAILLANKIVSIKRKISSGIERFDSQLPFLVEMRNVDQHFDDYAIDRGRNKKIDKTMLEVHSFDGQNWVWLGHKIDLEVAFNAGRILFKVLIESADDLKRV
jgi:hypothetical protein